MYVFKIMIFFYFRGSGVEFKKNNLYKFILMLIIVLFNYILVWFNYIY